MTKTAASVGLHAGEIAWIARRSGGDRVDLREIRKLERVSHEPRDEHGTLGAVALTARRPRRWSFKWRGGLVRDAQIATVDPQPELSLH